MVTQVLEARKFLAVPQRPYVELPALYSTHVGHQGFELMTRRFQDNYSQVSVLDSAS